MSWKEIRYYPITILIALMLLATGCTIITIIGKDNIIEAEVTDDIHTRTKFDSINVLTTKKESKEEIKKK